MADLAAAERQVVGRPLAAVLAVAHVAGVAAAAGLLASVLWSREMRLDLFLKDVSREQIIY